MMSDWRPLADADPVPGDPDGVRSLARHFGAIAEAASRHGATLASIRTGVTWRGEAASAFAATADQLPRQLSQVARRYDGVAEALSGYAPVLEAAQEKARRALRQAQQAQADARTAATGIDRMEEHRRVQASRVRDAVAERPAVPVPAQRPWSGPDFYALADEARADLAAARRLLDEAVAERDAGASRAERALAASGEDALADPEPSFWDRLGDAVVTASKVISDVAGAVSAYAGLLALLTAPFPAISGPLATVALVSGAVTLAADALLYTAGERSPGEVGMSALGVALGGIGKVADAAARVSASTRLTRAMAATAGHRQRAAAFADQAAEYASREQRLRARYYRARASMATVPASVASFGEGIVRSADAVTHLPWRGGRDAAEATWRHVRHPVATVVDSHRAIRDGLASAGSGGYLSTYLAKWRTFFQPQAPYRGYAVAWQKGSVAAGGVGTIPPACGGGFTLEPSRWR